MAEDCLSEKHKLNNDLVRSNYRVDAYPKLGEYIRSFQNVSFPNVRVVAHSEFDVRYWFSEGCILDLGFSHLQPRLLFVTFFGYCCTYCNYYIHLYQWFFCSAGGGGSVFDPLPPSPFPPLPFPPLSFSLPSLPPPPSPAAKRPLLNQLRGLGERCELPQRVRAEPGRQTFLVLIMG
jgi:hypothetical protein